jgi:hypothetical protein
MTPHVLHFTVIPILRTSGDGTVGRTGLPETSPNPTPGLFIDVDNPAMCSGVIREWNICYYNPRTINTNVFRDNLQISLLIWRFEAGFRNDDVGNRVARQVTTVSIPEEPEYFKCITIPQDEFMNITEGDVIGVSLSMNALLPVVANLQGESRLLFFHQSLVQPSTVSIQGNAFLLNQVLHVSAEIGERMHAVVIPSRRLIVSLVSDIITVSPTSLMEQTSTAQVITTLPSTMEAATTLIENQRTPGHMEDGGNLMPIVVATVVVILALLVTSGFVVGLTLFMRRHRNPSPSHPSHDTGT